VNARYFATRGFAVLIPTRIGYGVTGGPDVEFTGPCADKRVAAGTDAGASQVRQLLAWAVGRPGIDAGRGLLVGESFGGLVALAAGSTSGVRGVVSIAGGDGGDSLRHPDAPCGVDHVAAALQSYARTTHVPTLWMYSANDRLWGTSAPRGWLDAYRAAGGAATFVALPADKNNGHFIFTRNPPAWHPAFEQFAALLGFVDE
jgi:dienelactone hydrolase